MRYTQHTSESVSDGHPDKIADQISDAVLDHVLQQDPYGRVACEVLVKAHTVVISGEVTANASIDYMRVVADVLSRVYNRRVDDQEIELIIQVGEQSPEIAYGVDHGKGIGAGDQGIMYGYACDETPQLMPLPIQLSHQLLLQHQLLRKEETMLLADAKSQVTIAYQNHKPVAVLSVVLSTQHTESAQLSDVRELVMDQVIRKVIPAELLTQDTQYFVNPSGTFVRGGPSADCGLTGRKLMVDTYGGFSLHGGGAFSGKDSTKVDRTAAYMARYVAKHVVASKMASRCEVCLAYAIGVEKPVMIEIDTFGTAQVDNHVILERIKQVFDFTPEGMITALDLRSPRFLPTATFGHFGREGESFTWESIDKLNDLSL
ncbi:MAG: methionine adenosyltransferase [Pseudomonadota bacterium]|nr:methionine adenosyltransferase [Pseudomonadota bacterium]